MGVQTSSHSKASAKVFPTAEFVATLNPSTLTVIALLSDMVATSPRVLAAKAQTSGRGTHPPFSLPLDHFAFSSARESLSSPILGTADIISFDGIRTGTTPAIRLTFGLRLRLTGNGMNVILRMNVILE